MTPPMTRASRPRLASLGMLVWWAATSSAMPPRTPAGAPYEADGPDAHKLSLQPVGRGAHLDFERRRATTRCRDDGKHDGKACCHTHLSNVPIESCEGITYGGEPKNGGAARNCHQFFYFKAFLPNPD